MVNSSAGLAAKYFGNKSRTLVINASTNNPELVNMVTAFWMRKAGGVANPLGSNLANIYLMYLVAPLYVMLRWKLKRYRPITAVQGIQTERRLINISAWLF